MELATINHTEIYRVFSPIGQWKYHEYRHIKPLCHLLSASYLLHPCSCSFAPFSGKGDCLRPCPVTDPNSTKPCSSWAWCPGRAEGRPFPFSSCLPWDGDSDTSPTSSAKYTILFNSQPSQHRVCWFIFLQTQTILWLYRNISPESWLNLPGTSGPKLQSWWSLKFLGAIIF